MWHLDANHDIAAALSLSSSFGRGNLALVLERGALSLKTHKVGRVLGSIALLLMMVVVCRKSSLIAPVSWMSPSCRPD